MPRIEPQPTLAERVSAQLRERIACGEFPVGSMLPPETVLAEELGVSRNSAREAIRSLVHAGMLGARAGYGTYVTAASDVAPVLARRIGQDRADDVAEVRAILEREGARFAAMRATPAEVDALREALAARATAVDGEAYAAADIAFHRMLLDASGNELLAELYRGTGGNEQALDRLNTAQVDLASEAAGLAEIDHAHGEIVEAVAAGDPDAAAAAADHMVALVRSYETQDDGRLVKRTTGSAPA